MATEAFCTRTCPCYSIFSVWGLFGYGDSPPSKILLYHIRRGLVNVLSTEKFQLDIMEWASEEWLVCADFENVQVWNTQNSEVTATWNAHRFRSIGANLEKVSIGHCNGDISAWSLTNGQHLLTLEAHKSVVRLLKFVSGNRWFQCVMETVFGTWQRTGRTRIRTVNPSCQLSFYHLFFTCWHSTNRKSCSTW